MNRLSSNGKAYEKRNDLYISPHKFSPRSQPALRRRRIVFLRFGLIAFVFLSLFLILFPGFRQAVLPVLSLGLLGGTPRIYLETVRYYDLDEVQGTAKGWEKEERILICAPLRDAESHLPMFFSHLRNFTYPHHLLDLAFLVSDSKDNTLSLLSKLLEELQADDNPKIPVGEISIIEKDFGQKVNQDVESRHGFAAQASRRKLMAQARNWLLSAALRPTHSWVYWRDVDVETAPFTILEDLMRHNRDVIVPNVWRPLPDWLGGEQPYDLNSWQESDTALALAETLDEDAVIVEGYAEYATWRPHLAYLRDPYGDPDMEMEIDGVGGVSILAKAKVFRSGVHFPAFSYEKHAETEGFGKMAKRMKFSVIGLPHYTVWHLYEPSVDDLRHMEEMEQEKKQREKEEKEKQARLKKVKDEFSEPTAQWEKDKTEVQNMLKKEDDKTKKETHSGNESGPNAPAPNKETEATRGQDIKSTKESKTKEDSTDGSSKSKTDSKAAEAKKDPEQALRVKFDAVEDASEPAAKPKPDNGKADAETPLRVKFDASGTDSEPALKVKSGASESDSEPVLKVTSGASKAKSESDSKASKSKSKPESKKKPLANENKAGKSY